MVSFTGAVALFLSIANVSAFAPNAMSGAQTVSFISERIRLGIFEDDDRLSDQLAYLIFVFLSLLK